MEKELIPIILALTAWGGAWANRQIICHSDNQVVVACLRPRTSKCKGVMHLLCCVLFIEARMRCYLHSIYIDTHSNYLADALSRNNISFSLEEPRCRPTSHPLIPHPAEPPPGSLSRLDLATLEPSAQHYFKNSITSQRAHDAKHTKLRTETR